MRKLSSIPFVIGVVVITAASGCARTTPRWSLAEPSATADDMRSLTVDPKERDPSLYWDAVHQNSFYFMKHTVDLPRQYRKLTGRRHEAVNVDVFGEVPNSSWFTNRHGQKRLTREEIKRGPNRIDGPELTGPWTITRAKTQGVTPGFFFKDAKGEAFVLKFDPAMNPELATGSEMASTKLFHAFGYNVPENYLITFDPAILTIKDGLEYKDAHGHRQKFTKELLEQILTKVALRPDGKIRAVASRLLPGKPIGPFSYKGLRRDDPNDLIPHEHRRELRGIRIFAALVNNFDTKDHNTLDIVADEGGRRYVRHYLIDFSSTLGSDSDEPKSAFKGYTYAFDLEQALVSLFTLGLRQWSWEDADPAGMPASVGYFESRHFDPPGWKPIHGNPAFDNMTYADALWACRILSAFTQDDIRACVEAAEYSDTAATEYVVKTLWERRDKILAYYFKHVSPLADFSVADDGQSLAVSFNDAATDVSPMTTPVEYEVTLEQDRKSIAKLSEVGDGRIELPAEMRTLMVTRAQGAMSDAGRVFDIRVRPIRGGQRYPWVKAYVYFDGDVDHTRVVGVENDD